MKMFLMAGAMLLASAGSSFAQNSTTVDITAKAVAKCGVSGATSVAIGDLSDSDGRISSSAQGALLGALNGTSTYAWCSGSAGNKVVLSRTALVRSGSAGVPDANGFLTAALYDVGIDMPDVVNGSFAYDEGTSDGAGMGPVFGPFGASGAGSLVTFTNDTFTGALNGAFKGIDLTGKAVTYEGASNTFTQSTNRLQAGNYTSTLTLTLTPGT